MNILLDNCIDRNLAKLIVGHEVVAAAEIGWGDLGNGTLLAMAATRFDVMITVDKNIRYQQNLAKLPLPIIELDAVKNWVGELEKFVPYLAAALAITKRYNFVSIKVDGSMETLAERPS